MTKREQEIIAAAAKVFNEKGYHAATTRDIAAAVGDPSASLIGGSISQAPAPAAKTAQP